MSATKKTPKKATPKKKVTRKTTVKSTPKKRKVGSGRTKGSYSFITVKLTDLNKMLPESSVVMVSRKWAESLMALGIKMKGTAIKATTNAHNSLKKPVDITIKNTSNDEAEEKAQVALKTDF